jgi:exopolysaccharide biosynthesis polyprenyl glycosylphosphotransferase
MATVRGPAACLRRESQLRRGLVRCDILSLSAALALSSGLQKTAIHWGLAGAMLAVLVLSAKLAGLYDRDPALLRKSTLDELPAIVQVATICALASWLLAGAVGAGALSRVEVLELWATLAIALAVSRSLGRMLLIALMAPERCMVIGDELAARTLRSKLECGGGVRAELIAHVDLARTEAFSSESASASRLSEIAELAQSLDVHRAIIAPRSADAGEMLDLIRTLKTVGVRVSVLPRLLEAVGSSIQFDDLGGLMLMGISSFELTRSSAVLKRAFDVCCAALGLLALSPLLGAIALAIVLDSRGGVLFSQPRAGRGGRPFRIYKFRTMVAGAEAQKEALRGRNESEGLFKIRADPRITRAGGLLRRTALDELPQLINVLRGEMSLVGPRPLVLDEDLQVKGWYRRRLELTPGVTGPWQILGPARVPLREMAAIDYLYVANWSLWGDVKVLVRTVSYVAGRRGL